MRDRDPCHSSFPHPASRSVVAATVCVCVIVIFSFFLLQESALAEVLASTNLHPEIIGDIQHNLEDVLMAKNKATQRLEDSLDELKRKYARTIQLYEAKLAEFQIPVEELGFTATRRL